MEREIRIWFEVSCNTDKKAEYLVKCQNEARIRTFLGKRKGKLSESGGDSDKKGKALS